VRLTWPSLRSGKGRVIATLVVVLLTIACYKTYDKYGISSRERKVAIQTVYKIDGISSDNISDADLSRSEDSIRMLLADAHLAARTQRDKSIADDLDEYLFWSDLGRSSNNPDDASLLSSIAALDKSDPQRESLIGLWHKNHEIRQEMEESHEKNRETANGIRANLMKELE